MQVINAPKVSAENAAFRPRIELNDATDKSHRIVRWRIQFNPGTIGRARDDHLISLSGLKQHLAVSEAPASRAV